MRLVWNRQWIVGVLLGMLCWISAPAFAADPLPEGAVGSNVKIIGYNNLDDKPAFKMSIIQSGDRWYMYLGHFWVSGWTILDVTDPADTKIVKFITGPKGSFTGQMEISGNTMITGMEKPLVPRIGADPSEPYGEGVLIWDISDPVNPRQVGEYKTGSFGTHRNFYAGGKYMHLAARVPGFTGNIYVIVDISDPANPKEAGRWWVKGQKDGETPAAARFVGNHGPAYVVGNTAFLAYGSAGMIVLDISDVANPKQVSQLMFSPPFDAIFASHTVLPVPDKNYALVASEVITPDCKGPIGYAGIVDITDLTAPRLMSLMPTPIPPADSPLKTFCAKGATFGPHNINTLLHNPFVEPQGDLFYVTYWNAGLRIYDIKEPTAPREVAYFLPPDPRKRYGPLPRTLVAQTEDVLVDKRGYIYVTDNNQGVWILKYEPK
jgi:hypothetical protein